MLDINISAGAQHFLQSLPAKDERHVLKKIVTLAQGSTTNVKQLVQFAPLCRLRVGMYRIIFRIQNNILHIVLIDFRKAVYRNLKRKFK